MKCPLLVCGLPPLGPGEQYTSDAGECLQSKCAWWRAMLECCAIQDIARLLSGASRRKP